MVVCVCHNVTQKQIREAVLSDKLKEIKMCNKCRVCTDEVRDEVAYAKELKRQEKQIELFLAKQEDNSYTYKTEDESEEGFRRGE